MVKFLGVLRHCISKLTFVVIDSRYAFINFQSCLEYASRILNVQLGESSRLAWLGVEADPLVHSDSLLKAYNRPSENVDEQPSSKWFISKNAIVSGLGLLGIKQRNVDSVAEGESSAPRARRKRVVRKKVTASSS